MREGSGLGVHLQEGEGRADCGLCFAESVTCHTDRMEVEFSRELGNSSWQVYAVGRYCCWLGPFLCSLEVGGCLPAGLIICLLHRCEW